jgi:predicted RNA binding protein with dsRBD fold (UPF0201 family)
MRVRLRGSTPVNPTEDSGKILRSIISIFPDSEIEEQTGRITFETADVARFLEILRDHQIRDTAVMVLERALESDSTRFFLNKQAAFMGRVNFTDGASTLGDIEVTVEEGASELIRKIRPDIE